MGVIGEVCEAYCHRDILRGHSIAEGAQGDSIAIQALNQIGGVGNGGGVDIWFNASEDDSVHVSQSESGIDGACVSD